MRRLTVALSRARLGLYVLGRASVLESCFELKPAFDILLSRPTKLSIVTEELYDASFSRKTGEELMEGREAVMEGVEHLGQYVFEMTKAKVEAMKAHGGQLSIAGGDVNTRYAQADDEDADREENVVIPDEHVYSEDEPTEMIDAERKS